MALDLPRLAELGLDLGTVIDAVQGEGASIPGGALDVGTRRFNLKGTGDYDSLEEVADTVIATRGDALIRLRDVAEVGWSTEEQRYLGRYNGERAAFVTANMKERPEHLRRAACARRADRHVPRPLPPRSRWSSASYRPTTCASGSAIWRSTSCSRWRWCRSPCCRSACARPAW